MRHRARPQEKNPSVTNSKATSYRHFDMGRAGDSLPGSPRARRSTNCNCSLPPLEDGWLAGARVSLSRAHSVLKSQTCGKYQEISVRFPSICAGAGSAVLKVSWYVKLAKQAVPFPEQAAYHCSCFAGSLFVADMFNGRLPKLVNSV
jgi:hypothetical protein